jgi:hypothetical protein
VQDEQRGQQYHGRDGAADDGREHVGGQLATFIMPCVMT